MNRDVAIADLEHALERVRRVLASVTPEIVDSAVVRYTVDGAAADGLRQALHSIDRAVNELRYG